jgi:alcohol dehydrogenase
LVDTFTTPKLLRLIAEGRLDPLPFATHRFDLDEMMEAYDTFADAATSNAFKVVLTGHPAHLPAGERAVAATV